MLLYMNDSLLLKFINQHIPLKFFEEEEGKRRFGKMQCSGLTKSECLVSENAAIRIIQIILMRYKTVICSHNNNLKTFNINSNACLRTVLK